MHAFGDAYSTFSTTVQLADILYDSSTCRHLQNSSTCRHFNLPTSPKQFDLPTLSTTVQLADSPQFNLPTFSTKIQLADILHDSSTCRHSPRQFNLPTFSTTIPVHDSPVTYQLRPLMLTFGLAWHSTSTGKETV